MTKTLTATLTVATLTLAGCGGSNDDSDQYAAVCVDRDGTRVPDARCDHAPAFSDPSMTWLVYYWVYQSMTRPMPAVGARTTSALRTVDTGKYAAFRGGVPTRGGNLTGTYRPTAGAGVGVNPAKPSPVKINPRPSWKAPQGGSSWKAPAGGGYNKPAAPYRGGSIGGRR